MAANHYVKLTEAQRNLIIEWASRGLSFSAKDEYGNSVRVSFSEFRKGKANRAYVNFSDRYGRESLWINLDDTTDLALTFNGKSNWQVLEAALNEEIEARQPVAAPAEEVSVITSDMIAEFEIALEESDAFDAYLNEIGRQIGVSGAAIDTAFWNWRNAIIESVFVARGRDRWSPSEWAEVGDQYPMWEMFYEVIIPAISAGELTLGEIPATVEIFV